MILLIQGCARPPVQPPEVPFDPSRTEALLADIKKQQAMVTSAVCTGTLTVGYNSTVSRTNLLMAGYHQPLKLKIEVTHPWGTPLLHILVDGNDVRMVSFRDKRYVTGNLHDEVFAPYLPGAPGPAALWTLLRGYPDIPADYRALSTQPREIRLLDADGSVIQRLFFDPDSLLPSTVSFPPEGIAIRLSRFKRKGSIQYAGTYRLTGVQGEGYVEIELDEITFNRTLPEAVLSLQVPPGYRSVRLNGRPLE